MGAYWSFWVFMGPYGFLWVLVGSFKFLWDLMCPYGCWFLLAFTGSLCFFFHIYSLLTRKRRWRFYFGRILTRLGVDLFPNFPFDI